VIASATAAVSGADTAWMLAATALVLLMTPALGLFYAGLVRGKNTLNTFMMSIASLAIATVVWALIGYSLAFSHGNGIVGGFGYALLKGVGFAPWSASRREPAPTSRSSSSSPSRRPSA
jgi:ammonium transporter, Amt family